MKDKEKINQNKNDKCQRDKTLHKGTNLIEDSFCCTEKTGKQKEDNCCCAKVAVEQKEDNCICGKTKVEQKEDNCCCAKVAVEQKENDFCCAKVGGAKQSNQMSKTTSKHSKKQSKADKREESEVLCACCDLTANYAPVVSKRRIDKETTLTIIKLVLSLGFLVMGYFDWHHISGGEGFLMAFYYVNPSWFAVIVCGTSIFIAGIKSLRSKKLNASVLISIAMLASIGLEFTSFFVSMGGDGHTHSYIFAAGEIAFLMAIGELLENLTVKKCRSGIQRLVGLIPTEANVITTQGIERVALDKVKIGDIVVVKSGEMVAVDGTVTKGEASIDQSSLTGEYLPIDVSIGSSVFGGTMNKNGVVEVEVTKLQKDMTIAKMADLTIEAEGKKAPISRLADKWAGYIVPMVFVTSIIVGLVCGFGFRIGVLPSLIRAITVLVVFCPCALVLATPTAVAAGLGNAARNGVLVKSGSSLEELSRVDTLCFDKTGTITEGNIELQDVFAIGLEKEELLKLVASVEIYSEHPLALAVLAKTDKSNLYIAKNIKTMQGIGITADCNGRNLFVLSCKKAIENGFDIACFQEQINTVMSVGKTVVIVISDGLAIGMLGFSDTIRKNANAVMSEMSNRGYRTIMLTGDNEKSANYIAEQCNIKEVRHNLMPEDKLKAIEDIQLSGHKVAMIGDGINDAPSLKLANCSFAMGAMGSDIAIDTADMAILNSDIAKVGDTLRLSKRVMRTIKRNIMLAMTISVVAVICSAFGLLTPVTGALVHNCTSVLVVGSSALVLYNRKRKQKLS